jgi:uncharacterized protein YbaR (Trm112 family)
MNNEYMRKLICPKCHKFFGTMDTKDWPDIAAKHIKIVAGKRRKLKDGDPLSCSLCNYVYNTHDIILAGVSPDHKGDLKPGEEPTMPS